MQSISVALAASLALRNSAAPVSRFRTLLWEIYESNYLPPEDGDFDPADAIALWSRASITWMGNEYQRIVLSNGDITRFVTSQFNSVSMSLDNEDSGSGGFMSQFVVSNEVEGLRLVIRMIDPTLEQSLANSMILAVNRLDRPSSLDTETCSESARQDLASVDHEIPDRTFSPFDPDGRSASDPLYRGFQFAPTSGFFNVYTSVRSGGIFGLFSHTKLVASSQQYSSEQGTSANQVVPLIFGRCQMEMIPALWFDKGYYIIGLWVVAGHKVSAIQAIRVVTDGYLIGPGGWTPTIIAAHTHLGDPGGTGTNATADTVAGNFPANTALLSGTAYQGLAVFGPESPTQASANAGKDSVPTLTCIVLGEADLPGDGTFNEQGFTDNPAYLTRFILTNIIGLDASLIHNGECVETGAHCDELIKDDTNAELLVLTTPDAVALANESFTRVSSSGVIDTRSLLHEIDPDNPNPLYTNRSDALEYNASVPLPLDGACPDGFHEDAGVCVVDSPGPGGGGIGTVPPATIAPITYLRKRYTFNAPLTDKTKATSFLFDVVLPSFKGYILIGPDGRLRIRSEKPADSTYIRADANGGVSATGTATLNTLPADGDTLTVNGVVFTFRTAPSNSLEIKIGATVSATVSSAAVLLNASTDPLLSIATYTNSGGGVLTVTHDKGAAGNAFTLAKVSSHITLSGATLAGGVNGDSSIKVNDVERWRDSKQGLILIDPGSVTSETHVVTAAPYSTDGNAVTLDADATGTISLTASGATMAGGDGANTPASGTFEVGGTPEAGAQIVATIDGVAVAYTLNEADTLETAAAMLSASINAEWGLKGYVRASVVGAVDTVTSTLGSLTLADPLINAHTAILASPTVAPAAVAASSGSLPAGDYLLGYSRTSPTGETFISPVTTITVDGTQKINVSTVVLTGEAGLNWYLSKTANDPALVFLINNTGGAFSINALPQPTARGVPVGNGAGEETIRVMAAFNARNILKGKFSWPLADQGTPTNQALIKYREASKGFVERDLYVNDYDHQARTKKVNKVEIDGAGIDNFNQANRIANFRLSKEREGDFFVSWDTDVAGIVFEEGDVVCLTESNPGFIHLPVRIEQIAIHDDLSVSFIGRLYSTIMYSDQTGQHPIVLPTTLKYLNQPPPVATNLVLTEVGGYSPDLSFITGIRGDFDFGAFVATQIGHVFIKGPALGPSYTEPSDSTYHFVENVPPDSDSHGSFEVRALARGKYWVKVVVESAFGKSAASGHPVESIILSSPLDSLIKIFDNVPPKDVEMGLGLTIGVHRDPGVGAWHGTLLERDRGYGYELIANIDREATIGHTTNNSDIWLAATAGYFYFVDETGEAALASATTDEIAAGKMNFFVGREKIGVQTPTDLGGNIWKCEGLVRGLEHTEIFQATHTAQEDVILLDENVSFVPIELRDIGTALAIKPLTYGQNLSAVSPLTFTPRGDSIRPFTLSERTGARDGSLDWHLAAMNNTRASEVPASFIFRLRRVSDGAFLRDLPIPANGYRLAAMFKHNTIVGAAHDASLINNNVTSVSPFAQTAVIGLQKIDSTGAGVTGKITLSKTSLSSFVQLALLTNDESDSFSGYASFTINWNSSAFDQLQVTAIENVSHNVLTSPVLIPTIDGVIYFMLAMVGTEFRLYLSASGVPVPGTTPMVIKGSFAFAEFPVRLRCAVEQSSKVENVWIAGLNEPHTIYALRQQAADLITLGVDAGTAAAGLSTIDVEMWQVSSYAQLDFKGFSVREVF